eukprot:TRINITY_DN5616_c0_g1_i2.p1 TRINITY_DN5616_c0_g1~~TRINITY_DN5616_c0_g1_i2.p1  ORF type:complete len:114 (+),score=23.99 TRINITY_DN5616_c0_g1_i2:174-515(+)
MDFYSDKADEERTRLGEKFIKIASSACNSLKKQGYWADLADPFSGLPFLGSRGSTPFYDLEFVELLGFKIVDLNCCKAVNYADWGLNSFLGSIFTDAPVGVQCDVIESAYQAT